MYSVGINEQRQIVLPIDIIENLGIKEGTKFDVVKTGNEYVLKPISLNPLKEIQRLCEGVAEKKGWKTEDDVINHVNEFRRKRREKNAGND